MNMTNGEQKLKETYSLYDKLYISNKSLMIYNKKQFSLNFFVLFALSY